MEDKKNILIFLNSFWNNGKGMSGGDQMLIQIFNRIRNNFNNFYIYTNTDGEKVIKEGNIKDVNFKISNELFDKLNLLINYIFRTFKAFSCLKLKNINIIYSASDFFPDVLPAFLYKTFHKKTKWFQCIFHIYPDWRKRPGNKIRNFIAQYLQKFSFIFTRKADYIININTQVRDYLISSGFDKNKIIINTPGIDYNYFKNLEVKKNENKYDATFLARLNPSKGIFDLIDIWNVVVSDVKNAKLAIIGGGSNEIKNKLKEKIIEKKLENNIDILGFLENNDSFSLIKNSNIFLFPSHEEGFGIAIAEAMACGVPVISWDLSVYDEIFENNIIQIKENNINMFAEDIIKLLKNENEKNNIIIKANNFVKKYDWEKISENHFEILNK